MIDDSPASYSHGAVSAWNQVFLNPMVSSKPEHAHLFAEFGCWKDRTDHGILQRECATGPRKRTETKLDPRYYPNKLKKSQDQAWEDTARFQLDKKQQELLTPEVRAVLAHTPLNRSMSSHAVVQIKEEIAKGNTSLPKIPVVVWPYFEFGIGNSESLHIEEKGIRESKFLELSTDPDNFDPKVVWLGDTGYAYGWAYWCAKFNEHIKRAKMKRAALGLPLQWPIYIADFTDGAGRQRCLDIENEVGTDFVTYTERSTVVSRRWNNKTNWVDTGRRTNRTLNGKYYLHTPLVVRTDTIENLHAVLQSRGMKLSDPIEEIERKVDVTHLWPLKLDKVGSVYSNLRTKVSVFLDKLAKENKEMNIYVGLAGDPVRTGRRGVKSAYIEAMLGTKIMVVTQRDAWEDHYRLFEALVSGAMVMTDWMLALPKGLEHGQSIVMFNSIDDLREKIFYYLKNRNERLSIAREGRRISMDRHRAWHRIEEVIFGDSLTRCTGKAGSNCPYIVHTNETMRR